jgi:Na+-driven multidrug efflux pump
MFMKIQQEQFGEEPKLTLYASAWNVTKIASIVGCQMIVQMFQASINLYFISLENDIEMLAGTALGGSMMSVFGMTLLQSFVVSFETLASQSMGAGCPKQVGQWLWRARLITVVCFIPILFVLSFYTVPILLFFQQELVIAQYAQAYIRAYFPCEVMMINWIIMDRLFVLVGRNFVPMNVLWVSIPLHYVWCYYFCQYMDYGIVGIGYAGCVTNGGMLAFGIVYANMLEETKDIVGWPDSSIFKGWDDVFEISVPMFGQSASMRWSKEILVFFCGYISTESLAVEVILFNIMQYCIMFS